MVDFLKINTLMKKCILHPQKNTNDTKIEKFLTLYILKLSLHRHGRTQSIAACSKPRFRRYQEMPDYPTDVCPPKIVQK